MYCGSCLRDNALALATRALGHDMLLVPAYTPLRLDEESAADRRVFLGAVELYLEERLPGLRRRKGLLGRLLGAQLWLRWLSRIALTGGGVTAGRLTVSMLRGASGHQARSIQELIDYLETDVKPDVVHLTNALLAGLASPIRERLSVPVVCGLQGEDLFLDGLPARYREEAIALMRTAASSVDRFVATSRYYATHAAATFGIDPDKMDVVPTGIRLEDYETAVAMRNDEDRSLTVGYLARIAPEKGLHLLVQAFDRLVGSGRFPDLRLKAGGYLGGRKNLAYAADVRRWVASRGLSRQVEILGTLDREQKLAFLREIDVLSVPGTYPDPKGMYVIEALASGVPVVQPRHGAFPELIEATGGGVLYEPGDLDGLAAGLGRLLEAPELRTKMGLEGRDAVFREFSARRMAEAMLRAYVSVLGRPVA